MTTEGHLQGGGQRGGKQGKWRCRRIAVAEQALFGMWLMHSSRNET